MSKPKGLLNTYSRVAMLLIVFVTVIYLIVRNINTFGNLLIVIIGFGAVVLIHEFGHFIVAKLADIKVEAFSIGFPPILAGIKKTEKGYHIRILPDLLPSEDESGDGLLSFTVGKASKAGETEYRIGLIPFGGFVKMLGQEDTKSAEASDDPRSYANKPVGTRMAVIAAGVIFNAISTIIVFMIVFLVGINLMPAVVGGVVPDFPAARAGLRAGDEIIEIAGKNGNLDFSDILVASALSDVNEKVLLKIKHEDGSIENFELVAKETPTGELKLFGIMPPQIPTIAKLPPEDANTLFEQTGLFPEDHIKAINGKEVRTYWELEQIVQNALVSKVKVLAERKGELIESEIRLNLSHTEREVKSESDLSHICSIVPRLKITSVSNELGNSNNEFSLQGGDIILAAGGVENPTYKELRDVTKEYEDQELPLKVLRIDADGSERNLTVTVLPKKSKGSDRVLIGIGVALDAEHPVVAKTITTKEAPTALEIPRGAVITAVDKTEVSSFYEVIKVINQKGRGRVKIRYLLNEKSGNVVLELETGKNSVTVKSTFAKPIPFKSLERLYKATGPIDAVAMGYKKTVRFIIQSYVTLQRFIRGIVSPKNFIGPVGIVAFSYRIVTEKPLIHYAYFLGLISAFIAVFNFLPILPFDGGHIVFLLVEKIKGSAVNERIQGTVAYAGWIAVGGLALYVTFNDVVRSFF